MANSKSIQKAVSIRVAMPTYQYLKDKAKANNRSISGQINWIFKVTSTLQDKHPDIYAQIDQQLSKNESLNEKYN